MASKEIINEAARVMTDSIRDLGWMNADPLHFAWALADAGLLRPEMEDEWGWCDDIYADVKLLMASRSSSRRMAEQCVDRDPSARVLVRRRVYTGEWEEVEDGE